MMNTSLDLLIRLETYSFIWFFKKELKYKYNVFNL